MLRAPVYALPFLFSVAACHRESHAFLKASVVVADPTVTSQLTEGFYPLEGNRWRWTGPRFRVNLPGSVANQPETLVVNLFVPETHIEKLGQVTLRAELNGSSLGDETYQTPGSHTYVRVVPPEALASNILPFTFFVNRAAPPTPQEPRELGVVVTSMALQAN